MKRAMLTKKILKIILIPLLIIIISIFLILSKINSNKKYLNSIITNIKDNYELKEEILYINEYNNYYIFTTKNKVIVLNNEYKEILIEDINNLKVLPTNQELIYKTNKLMFEETTITKNKLIYKYYNAKTGEFIKETIMER